MKMIKTNNKWKLCLALVMVVAALIFSAIPVVAEEEESTVAAQDENESVQYYQVVVKWSDIGHESVRPDDVQLEINYTDKDGKSTCIETVTLEKDKWSYTWKTSDEKYKDKIDGIYTVKEVESDKIKRYYTYDIKRTESTVTNKTTIYVTNSYHDPYPEPKTDSSSASSSNKSSSSSSTSNTNKSSTTKKSGSTTTNTKKSSSTGATSSKYNTKRTASKSDTSDTASTTAANRSSSTGNSVAGSSTSGTTSSRSGSDDESTIRSGSESKSDSDTLTSDDDEKSSSEDYEEAEYIDIDQVPPTLGELIGQHKGAFIGTGIGLLAAIAALVTGLMVHNKNKKRKAEAAEEAVNAQPAV